MSNKMFKILRLKFEFIASPRGNTAHGEAIFNWPNCIIAKKVMDKAFRQSSSDGFIKSMSASKLGKKTDMMSTVSNAPF